MDRLLATGALVETNRRQVSGYGGLLVIVVALAGCYVAGFLIGFLTYG
jgi:hypothetical protein